MILKKYLPAFILLFLAHFFLGPLLLIVTWCLLGVVFALWMKEVRFAVLGIVIMEISIGFIFWLAFWSGNDSITRLAGRFNTPVVIWPLLAIAINLVTAFLCFASFFYVTEILVSAVKRKKPAELKSEPAVIRSPKLAIK